MNLHYLTHFSSKVANSWASAASSISISSPLTAVKTTLSPVVLPAADSVAEIMDDLKVCMGEINEYYNMMPSVEIAAQMAIAFRGPNAVENYPNIDYDATLTTVRTRDNGTVRRGHTQEITSNSIPWISVGNE